MSGDRHICSSYFIGKEKFDFVMFTCSVTNTQRASIAFLSCVKVFVMGYFTALNVTFWKKRNINVRAVKFISFLSQHSPCLTP